jgi:hypothetical protein
MDGHGHRVVAAAVAPGTRPGGARRVIAQADTSVTRADDVPLDVIGDFGRDVMRTVPEKRPTWTRWNLHAEATRQTMG